MGSITISKNFIQNSKTPSYILIPPGVTQWD